MKRILVKLTLLCLLEAGARIDVRTKKGETVIDLANREIVKRCDVRFTEEKTLLDKILDDSMCQIVQNRNGSVTFAGSPGTLTLEKKRNDRAAKDTRHIIEIRSFILNWRNTRLVIGELDRSRKLDDYALTSQADAKFSKLDDDVVESKPWRSSVGPLPREAYGVVREFVAGRDNFLDRDYKYYPV